MSLRYHEGDEEMGHLLVLIIQTKSEMCMSVNSSFCYYCAVVIRPLPEGGLLWFHHVLFLLFFVQSQKSPHLVGHLINCLYMFSGPLVHWRHSRGRQIFCLQKSRMPLAELVYLITQFHGDLLWKWKNLRGTLLEGQNFKKWPCQITCPAIKYLWAKSWTKRVLRRNDS